MQCVPPAAISAPSPQPRTIRIDSDKLPDSPQGAKFNASVIRFRGRLLLAYRTGWAGAQCHIAELSDDGRYTPKHRKTLTQLRHPQAMWGREDPRLFIFRDRLHIAFIGVDSGSGPTNQMYARLNDDLSVSEVFYPRLEHRQTWEKNWQFFEWMGELFAVYETGPTHRIHHIVGNNAYPFSATPNKFPFSGGTLRGGAPPVRVGDYFYHWFHGRIGPWAYGIYSVGLNVFEAKPPFRVVRQTAHPLRLGDKSWRLEYQGENFPAAIFPSGAILEQGKWIVSAGIQDHWIELMEWDMAEIEASLSWLTEPKPAEQAGICQYLGDTIPHAEREYLGLSHRKEWRECSHPQIPLGMAVCSCKGCGPKCSGYVQFSEHGHESETGTA